MNRLAVRLFAFTAVSIGLWALILAAFGVFS